MARRGPVSASTGHLSAGRFLLVTFAVSWSCGALAGLGNLEVVAIPSWVTGVSNLGFLAGPGLGALAARASARGGARRALLEDAHPGSPRWHWLAVVAGLVGAACVAALLVMTGGTGNQLGATEDWLRFPLVIVATTLVALPEELGWRATLLPALRSRWGHRAAVLGIGVVWGVWHLPLLVTDSGINAGVPVYAYPALALGLSPLLAWLYDASQSSPIVTAIAHGSLNAAMTPLLVASHDMGELDRLYAVAVLASVLAGSVALAWHQPPGTPRPAVDSI